MKSIDAAIFRYILEIGFAIFVIVFTGFIWNTDKISTFSTTAAMYDNSSIIELYTEELEKDVKMLQSVDLIVRNHSKNDNLYKLIMVVSKNSKLDLNNLVLTIDDEIIYVKELEKFENQSNNFYVIRENALKAYSQDEIIVDILSEGQTVDLLHLTFVLDKGQFN